MMPPSGGWIIRRQVRCLIGDLLGDAGVDEQVRLALLRHLAEHPGDPERALLAHVSDWHDREEPMRQAQRPVARGDTEAGQSAGAEG
jgi:hypothetical protein